MGRNGKKSTKVKIDKYDLIDRDDPQTISMYLRLDNLVTKYHSDLEEARIALAWMHGVTPDKDGRLKLGQCKIVTSLDRQLHRYDIVIMINHEAWQQTQNETWRDALIDHELCHALQAQNKDGEQKTDAKGHGLYRSRGHDVEDFVEIVRRYGPWKADLEAFLAAGSGTLRPRERDLLTPAELPVMEREYFEGFTRLRKPLEGKALTTDGAREMITRYVESNNRGARNSIQRRLEDAGWVPEAKEQPLGGLPPKVTESLSALHSALAKNGATLTVEIPESAKAGKDRKTTSAGA